MSPELLPVEAPVARLRGIEKRYRSTVALSGADLDLQAGEVHGLLGENGAGKSTLLGILGGVLRADGGVMELDGTPVSPRSPREAWALGVGLVHQHFTLVPRLTVLENLALGHRGAARGWRMPLESIRRRAEVLMAQTGLDAPLDATVEQLGVGDRQRIEILKALLRSPRILALDEPTAVLTPGEVTRLFDLLRGLAESGTAVVLVAHKLDEVLAVAHRVTVMREGHTVLTSRAGDQDASSLTRAMVGSAPPPEGASGSTTAGPEVACLEGVRVRGRRGEWALNGVSLGIRRGEILGIAGVEGNGQRELALVLAGRLSPEEGDVDLPAGTGFVPQDRTGEGLVGDFDLVENMALALHRHPALNSRGILRWADVRRRAVLAVDRYGVRSPGLATPVRALSGGNQQRLVVAREMAEATDLLVAENPTRGLDVAATAFVHAQLRRLVGEGSGAASSSVALISTDLDEVLSLAHRILVMVRGQLVPVPDDDRSREHVGRLMLAAGGGSR